MLETNITEINKLCAENIHCYLRVLSVNNYYETARAFSFLFLLQGINIVHMVLKIKLNIFFGLSNVV